MGSQDWEVHFEDALLQDWLPALLMSSQLTYVALSSEKFSVCPLVFGYCFDEFRIYCLYFKYGGPRYICEVVGAKELIESYRTSDRGEAFIWVTDRLINLMGDAEIPEV